MSHTPEICAQEWVSQSRECLEQCHFCRADAVATQGLRQYPDEGKLWEIHGAARFALRDFAGACEALETATTLTPLQPFSQIALAEAYLELEHPEVARTILIHLADWERSSVEILSRVAKSLGRLAEYETALAVCQRITRLEPFYHPAYFGVAFYLARLERAPEEAILPLTRAVELAPKVTAYRLNLGFVLWSSSRHAEAYQVLRRVPLREVESRFWLNHLIQVFEIAGDFDRAVQCRSRLGEPTDSD